jgi:hypothetical protein
MIALLLSIALACSPQAKFKERCIQHCIDDQEPAAWIPAPFVCVCGAPRKLGNSVPLKLPRNFTGNSIVKPEAPRGVWDD